MITTHGQLFRRPADVPVFRESSTGRRRLTRPRRRNHLSLEGGAWTRSPTEDVFVGLLLADGMVINADVTFDGGFGQVIAAAI